MSGSFKYNGKNGTLISSRVLPKAHRKHYKNDIIEITVVSKSGGRFIKAFTPYETEILLSALSLALMDYDTTKRRIKK